MQYPIFNDHAYLNAVLFNNAIDPLENNETLSNQTLYLPGIIPQSQSSWYSTSGLTVTATFPTNFAILFSTGQLSYPLGVNNGSTSNIYSVNLTSFIPSSGSQTVYVVAQYTSINTNPTYIPGAPAGSPDYDPNYSPSTQYTQQNDSFALVATTSVPNNTTSIEVFRTVLTAGQSSISVSDLVLTYAIQATPVLFNLNYNNGGWNFGSNISVAGNASISGNATAASFLIGGNSVVTSFAGRYGAITPSASDYSSFYGQLSGTNSWTAANTFGSTVNISGAATLGNTLSVTGNITAQASISVTQDATVSGTLGVTGVATFSSPVVVTSTSGAITNTAWTTGVGIQIGPSVSGQTPAQLINAPSGWAEDLINFDVNGVTLAWVDSSGNIHTAGNVYGNQLISTSSRELKENIDYSRGTLPDTRVILNKLQPATYTWKKDIPHINKGKESWGFIAEDLQEIDPKLAEKWGINVAQLTQFNTIALKNHEERLTILEEKLNNLLNKV